MDDKHGGNEDRPKADPTGPRPGPEVDQPRRTRRDVFGFRLFGLLPWQLFFLLVLSPAPLFGQPCDWPPAERLERGTEVGPIEWSSYADVAPGRQELFNFARVLKNLGDATTAPLHWEAGGISVDYLSPGYQVKVCDDVELPVKTPPTRGDLFYLRGTQAVSTRVWQGDGEVILLRRPPEEVIKLETRIEVGRIDSDASDFAVRFTTKLEPGGSERSAEYVVENMSQSHVEVWLPWWMGGIPDDLPDLAPADSVRFETSPGRPRFVNLPVVIYSEKLGTSVSVLVPTFLVVSNSNDQ